jgi:hypothetical protein
MAERGEGAVAMEVVVARAAEGEVVATKAADREARAGVLAAEVLVDRVDPAQ